MKTESIRELNKEKDRLLEEYHAAIREIDAKIDAIRAKRGTKLKEPSWSGYREQGRDMELRNGN